MINKGLYRSLLGLFLLSSPGFAQPGVTAALRLEQNVNLFSLLQNYQIRFIKGTLSKVEFEYAHQWLCPQFPDLPEMHLCNSSVVGTSEEEPNNESPLLPGYTTRIPVTLCPKCILKLSNQN